MDITLELLTYDEVAQILGVSVPTVRRYTKRELDPLPVKYLSPHRPRVIKTELKEWIKSMPDPRTNV